ncbi:MAG: pyrroline-5-carboxylate reductase [Acidobacteria bacterium]|nr:MAG: pyrroline-5-carboxylate reductase [Acidobacteriota bacterium]PYS84401.1 MAG: pyrroline-5-carboxylate reductase [Acidobacteriota bacterium]
MTLPPQAHFANPLRAARLSFVGVGVMAEAMIAGLLRRQLVERSQIVGSHPRAARREEMQTQYGIRMVEGNREAATLGEPQQREEPAASVVILAVKPQRIGRVLHELKGALAEGQLVLSIVAGARMEAIAGELLHPPIVRAMPNTPAQIGQGMTAWTATPQVSERQLEQVRALLGALGREMYVENENMIDMATALSATGPTYIFMMMEALVDAGVHMGFSRHVAEELVIQTMLGSVLFARETHKHPAELRNMVTSPGGTSAEAIYQMEKGSLRTVLSKAVYAAYQRAVALGRK